MQLPMDVCSYQYITVNYSVINEEGTELNQMLLEPYIFQGPDNVTSSVKSGLLKDQNYTLKVMVASARGTSFSSRFINFGE